ncbi:MAG: Eco57I restriction-modification methylase domain-containing protein [Candidatus Cloacimonetes bacterium]|nr:Eco57I restriction-modification methylase domain-containing protein [Candidatus Cloacimonadota bacterium]
MTFNFNAPYNRENWITFFRQQFLPQDFSHITEKVTCEFKSNCINEDVLYLGESQSLKLKVYEMQHDSENDPRIGLSRDAFKFIEHQKVKNALILFISENSENYRLSLITRELKLEGKKVTKEFTNPKRYSYFMGPDVKKHTIEEFLVKKGRIKDEEDLKSRFSVEIVNKEFYNNIAELFTELVGGVRKIGRQTKEFKQRLKLPDTTNHTLMQEFAVRLIGRIVFCWFLKKKKSENGISLIPEEVLSVKAIKDNYYHTILEPLFFEVMNTPINERKERYKTSEVLCHPELVEGERAEDDKSLISWSSIPFLNGGLFDPNLHQDYYKTDDFQGKSIYQNTLVIPDDWFVKFFSILELYNFTIDENTSIDIELSVDPEMLGRIFENLLAEINPETQQTARKATGSYYTPRPIVEYMVDESLIQYLLTKLDSPPLEGGIKGGSSLEQKIRNLLDYTIEENELTKDESLKVIDALDKIKILDPACGSGAFPMGILQKMLLIRQKVDPESIEWVMKQLEMIPDQLVRKTFEDKLMDENWDYKYKMSAILHSIYGVDIQTIAVELSKLRFFLTLMVDETVNDDKPNRGINELPNLSFKFVAANTLIGLPEAEKDKQMDLMDFDNLLDPMMKKLEKLREQFFYASGNEKTEIEQEFKKTQIKIGQFLGKEGSTNKRAVALANWDPFADKSSKWFDPKWMFGMKDGFDIIIANPPYVRQEKIRDFKPLLQAQKFEVYNSTSDLYTYFYELSYNLINENGISTFISSNKWMRAKYGFKLRKFFKENTNINQIIDFGGYQVFDATVDTNIMMFQKPKQKLTKSPRFGNFGKDKKVEERKFNVYQIKDDFEKTQDLTKYFANHKLQINQNDLDINSFTFADEKVMNLKKKIEKIGTPLKDWDISIYRGIITGFNEAFIISGAKKDELIAKNSKSVDIIKPILRGRDIKRYKAEFSNLWVIIVKFGAYKTLEYEYPAVYDHLLQFKEKLKNRGQCRYSRGRTLNSINDYSGQHHWLELDNNPKDRYLKQFEMEKIVYQEMVQESSFVYDLTDNYFCLDTGRIITGESLKYVISIMNSKLFFFSVKQYYGGGSLGSKGVRMKHTFLENFPLPKFSEERQKQFEVLVDQILSDKKAGKDTQKLEDQIDLMVYKLYELTYVEVKIVDPETALSKVEYDKLKLEGAAEIESTSNNQDIITTSDVQKTLPEEAAQPTNLILTEFSVGQHVFHPTFGEGEVLHVTGSGEAAKLTVKFGRETKKLIAGYAKLSGV